MPRPKKVKPETIGTYEDGIEAAVAVLSSIADSIDAEAAALEDVIISRRLRADREDRAHTIRRAIEEIRERTRE
jgi:hypothetical protein